jgi:hypothetical protein
LHKKFAHFEKSDLRKYNEIREMNLEDIRKLKEEIKGGYQVVMSQLLGFLIEEEIKVNQIDAEEETLDKEVDHQNQSSEIDETNDRIGRFN